MSCYSLLLGLSPPFIHSCLALENFVTKLVILVCQLAQRTWSNYITSSDYMLILVIRLVSALANFCLSEEPLARGLKKKEKVAK